MLLGWVAGGWGDDCTGLFLQKQELVMHAVLAVSWETHLLLQKVYIPGNSG